MRRGFAGAIITVCAAGALAVPGAGAAGTAFPGPEAWRVAARSSSPVGVTLAGRRVEIVVRETTGLLAPGATVTGLDGRPVDPGATALAGKVVGAPGSWVRLTAGPDWVIGHIVVPGLGTFAVGRDDDGGPVALSGAEVARRIRAAGLGTVIEPGEVEGAETCDSLSWTPRVASPVTLIETDTIRTFEVAFAVDETFVSHHPADWAALATAFVNDIDGLFRAAFDVSIAIVHLVSIPDAAVPSTTTTGLLAELQNYYVATYPSLKRENVHLFTGKDTTNAAGQVNCVGSAGRTTVSYSVAQGDPGGPYVFGPLVLLPDGAFKISAHELAHTLSDHHHYSNCAETIPTYDPLVTLDVCTVMINDWGLIQPVFSSVDRLTVRGWVDFYDI